jgi:hypothetical protein
MRATLNQIRKHSPCRSGWEKLLRGLGKTAADDEPLWIDEILDYNGLDDALWCLRAVERCDREIRLYAVWCARRGPTAAWAVAWPANSAAEAAAAAAWAASRAAAWAAGSLAAEASALDAERAAQAEELRRVCREMREAGR